MWFAAARGVHNPCVCTIHVGRSVERCGRRVLLCAYIPSVCFGVCVCVCVPPYAGYDVTGSFRGMLPADILTKVVSNGKKLPPSGQETDQPGLFTVGERHDTHTYTAYAHGSL